MGIERILLRKNKRHRDYLRTFDVSTLLPHHAINILDHSAVREAEGLNLDVLVVLDSTEMARNIAGAARLGIITLGHCDTGFKLAGFWNVYLRDDTTEFTIQRLLETSDEPQRLMQGRIGTEFYFLLNRASLCEKSTYYLTKLIEQIAVTGTLPTSPAGAPSAKHGREFPKQHETISYLAGLARLVLRKAVRKCFRREATWNVAFAHNDWKHTDPMLAPVIPNPAGRFLADPFVVASKGREFCFVEDFDRSARRGRISVYELRPDSAAWVGVAIDETFHLSFPYLFEYGRDLYMCPETSESREIRVYRCLEFPLHWKLERVIMKDVSAVDTMLFEKDGNWWMFTNIDPAGWGDFSLELHIFSANSPLDHEWTPHSANPLFVDASRARNAGLVRDGSRLFRVAQAKGFDMYGKQVSINEILKLDEENYVEKCVRVITPTFRKGIRGTHHLHSNGTTTVFDFCC